MQSLMEEQDIYYFQERNWWGGERGCKSAFSALIRHGGTQHMPHRMQTLEGTLRYVTMYMQNANINVLSFTKDLWNRKDADILRKTYFLFFPVCCMCYVHVSVCEQVHVHMCVCKLGVYFQYLSQLVATLFMWDWVFHLTLNSPIHPETYWSLSSRNLPVSSLPQ